MITFKGQRATVESFVLENTELKLLSLVGARESVRAIWAGLALGEAVTLDVGDEGRPVTLIEAPMKSVKLECGKTQLLATSTEISDGQIVIARDDVQLQDRLWAAVLRHCTTPLHATWRDWVLRELETTALETTPNLLARRLTINQQLTDRVQNAVKWGLLCA